MTEHEITAAVRAAMMTLKSMPPAGPRGYKSCMPDYLRSSEEVWSNAVAAGRHEEMRARRDPPTRDQYTQLDTVLDWLIGLPRDQSIALTGLALGVPANVVGGLIARKEGRRKGYSRFTVYRRRDDAVRSIVATLGAI